MLPLLNLNRFSFGSRDNFVDSYISNDDHHIVVKVNSFQQKFTSHQNYRFDFSKDSHIWIVYEIPGQYLDAVKKFREGKFSQFSNEVKSIIKSRSGLKWRVPRTPRTVISAIELLALDRDRDLKDKIERSLEVKLPDDAELMSIPEESNYIDIELD